MSDTSSMSSKPERARTRTDRPPYNNHIEEMEEYSDNSSGPRRHSAFMRGTPDDSFPGDSFDTPPRKQSAFGKAPIAWQKLVTRLQDNRVVDCDATAPALNTIKPGDQDNRMVDCDATAPALNTIKPGDQVCLKLVLNIVFLTIGVSLLLAIIVVIIYTSVVPDTVIGGDTNSTAIGAAVNGTGNSTQSWLEPSNSGHVTFVRTELSPLICVALSVNFFLRYLFENQLDIGFLPRTL